jgi:hypothetical protein
LQRIVTTRPVNIKLLQLQLQGSVSVSVNEGPGEIASIFLGDAAKDKNYDKKLLKKLRNLFNRFLQACDEALKINGDNIKADQVC